MALLAALTEGHTDVTTLLTEALSIDRPELSELLPAFAGVFVLPYGNAGDCLIWFRREMLRTVDWLGAQSADNRVTALSPRTSFDSWRQMVTDRCAPWEEMQVAEAAELARDIDQVLLRLAEAQMAHMALHDALTGLPNRRLLVERISTALDRADRHGGEVAILFCDLDDFKRVNDTAGHAAGDAVLVEVAARLNSVLRAGDSVARVGGDEFVIVLEPVGDGGLTPSGAGGQREPATAIAERVKAELSRPIHYQDREHIISVSVGITFAESGGSADDSLRDADVAMYRAKRSGKNRVATFDDSLRAGIFERATAERALHAALDHSRPDQPRLTHPQLTVAYQPLVEVDSGRLVGFEALPRLTDSAGEPIRHEVFTYVAEHTALTGPLGEAVLDMALSALVGWRAEHPEGPSPRIGVNMSARQAQQADMPAVVRTAVDRHGLRPSDLVLELTESVLIEAGSSTLRQLNQLRESGVSIAIDDFGTGNTSLSHLALLPVDAIKVDRTFVHGLPGNTVNGKIVRAVAGLAADLGLVCIFDGIDSDEQLAGLPKGVLAQGAVFGASAARPLDRRPRRSVWPAA
jgi:diguanylate cyclase (GGDEF)-like protein